MTTKRIGHSRMATIAEALQQGTVFGSVRRMFVSGQSWGAASLWEIAIAVGVGVLLGGYAVAITYLSRTWATLFTAGVVVLFVAMIVRNVRRLLLAIIILDIPFQLDINLFYRLDASDLGSLGGLNVSLTTISLLVLYGLWVSESLLKKSPSATKWLPMSVPGALYVLFAGLSVLVARDKTLAAFELALIVQLFLIHLYILGTVRTRDDVLYIVTLILIGLFAESLIIFALRIMGTTVKIAGITGRVFDTRVSGTVGSPNNAGAFLVLSLGPALGLLLARVNKTYGWLAAVAFASGAIALIFTLSRGGWLAFVVFLGFFGLLALQRGWLSGRVVAVLVLVALVLFVALNQVIITRLTADDQGAAESRIPLMRIAWRMIRDRPLLGVGLNNGPILLPSYITPDMGDIWVYGVHNKYLAVWSETGPGGLLAFLWFLMATLRRGWRSFRAEDPLLSPVALGLLTAVLGHMVHMAFDTFRDRPNTQLLWLYTALIAVMYLISRGRAEAQDTGT